MFAPHQFGQIILSDVGILLWLGALTAWIYQSGFSQVFRLYLVPYLWWAILPILDLSHILNIFEQGEPLAGPHHLLATYRPVVAALSGRGIHIPSWCSGNA